MAAWDFKYSVADEKDRTHPAPFLGGNLQGVLHARTGDGDADAIEIRDDGQEAQEEEIKVGAAHGYLILPAPWHGLRPPLQKLSFVPITPVRDL